MTSGQYSPLTPTGAWATTAQYGNIDRPFDLTGLAAAAGATYAARASTCHVALLKNYVKSGLQNKGFSVIECISTCPTYFGRKNDMGDAAQMQLWLKDNCAHASKRASQKYDKPFLYMGEFVNLLLLNIPKATKKVIRKAGEAMHKDRVEFRLSGFRRAGRNFCRNNSGRRRYTRDK
jgi:2-oxoglutarate ferredoxin oxidoreductase subunit beta